MSLSTLGSSPFSNSPYLPGASERKPSSKGTSGFLDAGHPFRARNMTTDGPTDDSTRPFRMLETIPTPGLFPHDFDCMERIDAPNDDSFSDLIPSPGTAPFLQWMSRMGDCLEIWKEQVPGSVTDDSLHSHWSGCPSPRIDARHFLDDCCVIPRRDTSDNLVGIRVDKPLNSTENRWDVDLDGLIKDALAILRDNIDIVRWAACLMHEDLPECLVEYLFGDSNKKHLRISYSYACNPVAYALGACWWNEPGCDDCVVTYCLGKDKGFLVRRFESLLSGIESYDCAAALLSMNLLHEISHCCHTEIDREDRDGAFDKGPCSPADALAGIYGWALGKRFPCLATSGCGDFSKDFAVIFGQEWNV